MSTTVGLKLEPLDVLFFRDGRPFGVATRGRSGLPFPQTLAGALWTALLKAQGCDFRQLAERIRQRPGGFDEAIAGAGGAAWIASLAVRGPWLARQQGTGGTLEVLVPAPSVLQAEKGTQGEDAGALRRLRPWPPDRLPGWRAPESSPDLWPLWLQHPRPTQPVSGRYLSSAALDAFLQGAPVRLEQLVQSGDLFELDDRTGIGIDPDRLSAEEGLIYGASFLALQPEVALYAEAVLPDGVGPDALAEIATLAFGGEGRRVRLCVLDEPYRWPEHVPAAAEKPIVLLTTPGLFQERWKPRALNGRLLAAAVPGADAVSGWDLARGGPKPNRFAAQAGSVYFLNQPLDPWPETFSDDPRDAQQGWGCYLKGVWTDA